MIEVEQETMKGRAKSAGSEAMVQSINQAMSPQLASMLADYYFSGGNPRNHVSR